MQTVIKPGDVLNTRDLGELHLDSALDRSQRLFLGTMGGRGALGCLNTHTGRGEAVHNIHGSSNKTHTLYVLKHVYMYYLYFKHSFKNETPPLPCICCIWHPLGGVAVQQVSLLDVPLGDGGEEEQEEYRELVAQQAQVFQRELSVLH